MKKSELRQLIKEEILNEAVSPIRKHMNSFYDGLELASEALDNIDEEVKVGSGSFQGYENETEILKAISTLNSIIKKLEHTATKSILNKLNKLN